MRDTILSMDTALVYLLLFLVTLLGAYLLLSLRTNLDKVSQSQKDGKRRGLPKLGCLTIIFLFLVAFSLISLTAFINSFHRFTQKELVAVVECQPAESEQADFKVILSKMINGNKQEPMVYDIKGDQWALGGDILKWEDYVNFLGLHTMYRLTRLEGRFEDASKTQENQKYVYSLTQDQKSEIWRLLYKIGQLFPFIESSYGNTVYTYPSYQHTFNIYVTTSGFMVDKTNKE